MPKEVETKMGKFTDNEVELFNKGIKKYGKDPKKVAELIGTRTSAQVSRKMNHNLRSTGELMSPVKGKKRATTGKAAATPSKKAKTTGAKVVFPAEKTKSSSAVPPKAAPSSRPARATKKEDSEDEEEETPEKETTEEETEETPEDEIEKTPEVVPDADETPEVAVTTMLPPALSRIIEREEVQAILAGLGGFIASFLVKKFFLS